MPSLRPIRTLLGIGAALQMARDIAERVASKPRASACMTKQTVNAVAAALDQTASHMGRDQFLLSFLNDDSQGRVSAFLQKGKPESKSR